MGNSCRGSFGNKYFRENGELTDRWGSKHNLYTLNNSISSSSSSGGHKISRGGAATIKRPSMDSHTHSVLRHKTANIHDLYTIGRKLGQGQFGTTHLCTEISTGLEYACKSISKRKLITSEDVEDVRREIQIMHHLCGHKSVIQIKGAYEDPLYVHIVMELCEGGELFDRIIQTGHYSERKAAELTKIVVGVVQACHSLGVMHRDLKPENFLLADKDDDLSLKAIDFGLSVFFKPGNDTTFLQKITLQLRGTFSINDIGSLSSFLGISFIWQNSTLLLSQTTYIAVVHKDHDMDGCKPCDSSMSTAQTSADSPLLKSKIPTKLKRITGALQYFLLTCPDISHSTSAESVSTYMLPQKIINKL